MISPRSILRMIRRASTPGWGSDGSIPRHRRSWRGNDRVGEVTAAGKLIAFLAREIASAPAVALSGDRRIPTTRPTNTSEASTILMDADHVSACRGCDASRPRVAEKTGSPPHHSAACWIDFIAMPVTSAVPQASIHGRVRRPHRIRPWLAMNR